MLTCVGHSQCRWVLDKIETIETGVFIPADWEYIGGGSIVNWINGLDPESPLNSRWTTFEADVNTHGPVTGVWWAIAVRNPAQYPGEPYPSIGDVSLVFDKILDIAGSVAVYVTPVAHPEPSTSCFATTDESHEVAKALVSQMIDRHSGDGAEIGPTFLPCPDAYLDETCHAIDPVVTDRAELVHDFFTA